MSTTLEKLYQIIKSRKGVDPETSYVSRLFFNGRRKIAEKVGEEAVETIIAALTEDNERTVNESADLLFHLSVLWADKGVTPDMVMNELDRRMGISGLDEKAARKAREKSL